MDCGIIAADAAFGITGGTITMKYGSLPDVDGRVSRLVMGSMVFSTGKQELTNELLDRFLVYGETTTSLVNASPIPRRDPPPVSADV